MEPKKVDLDTLLASADIICLCANLTEEKLSHDWLGGNCQDERRRLSFQ